jgi:uncharacterized protein YjbI with pentapeptide repeats
MLMPSGRSILLPQVCLAVLLAVLCTLSSAIPSSAASCTTSAGPGIDWTECDKKVIILSGSDLGGATLFGTDFTSTDLRDTNLQAANLEKATLVRASLAGSNAVGARFDRIEAYRTNFSGMDGRDATFASAEMQRSNFKNALLTNVDFTKAELGRADFTDADISGARFALTNLARADLSKSKFKKSIDLARSFLFLTRIEGLDLSAVTGLEQWQVDMACGDAATKLPAGLQTPSNWPCQFD